MMRVTRIMAGLMIVVSVLLGMFVSIYWLYFTLFVGLNLFQYGITDWCPMEVILKKFGYSES